MDLNIIILAIIVTSLATFISRIFGVLTSEKVTAKSKGEITSIVVEDEILKSGDREMIQDLIQAAINEVLDKGRENIKEEMSKAASSMGIPPGFL